MYVGLALCGILNLSHSLSVVMPSVRRTDTETVDCGLILKIATLHGFHDSPEGMDPAARSLRSTVVGCA